MSERPNSEVVIRGIGEDIVVESGSIIAGPGYQFLTEGTPYNNGFTRFLGGRFGAGI